MCFSRVWEQRLNKQRVKNRNGKSITIISWNLRKLRMKTTSKNIFWFRRLEQILLLTYFIRTLEENVKKLGIPSITILQPPGLIRKNSDRFGEKLLVKIPKFVNSIGLFKDQKLMKTESVAATMINIAKSDFEGHKTISAQDILDYAQ